MCLLVTLALIVLLLVVVMQLERSEHGRCVLWKGEDIKTAVAQFFCIK